MCSHSMQNNFRYTEYYHFLLGFWAIFPSQQQTEQQAVAGISTNINIECNLGRKNETPFWIIDGTVYELFSIPTTFLPDVSPAVIPVVESYSGLTIPLATVELDETTFQCAIFSDSGVVMGSDNTVLRILPSKYGNSRVNYDSRKTLCANFAK